MYIMDKCLSLSKSNIKDLAKKMSFDYKNKTKKEVCYSLLNDFYLEYIEITYNCNKDIGEIKKYIDVIINTCINVNISLNPIKISHKYKEKLNHLAIIFYYNTYIKNDPINQVTSNDTFKIKIKGKRYKFFRHSIYVNYIKPFENAHLKILNRPGPKSLKTSIPSFTKMPIINNLNIDRPLDSNIYYNISKFLNNMKKTLNESGQPFIRDNVCIIDINDKIEFYYNVYHRQFYNIVYLLKSIHNCLINKMEYIAIPFIFEFPDIRHATALFIDTNRKKVEYFDSLDHEYDYYYFINILENEFKKNFPQKNWMHKIIYMDIKQKDHFLQNTIDVWGGACVLYTTIFLTMRCIYPKMSLNHVKLYFDKAKSNDEKRNILRKFANYINKNNQKNQIMNDFDENINIKKTNEFSPLINDFDIYLK